MTKPAPLTEEIIQQLLSRIPELRREISKVIVGQKAVIDELLVAFVAGGHCLLEGLPGLGKTLLIRTLAQAVDLTFHRIQFTPDLMPSDIIGTEVLEEDHVTGKRFFQFNRGPIFGQIILADEINRTPPKTQSALLEAMSEGSVTYGGQTYALDRPFFVLATQNPIEQSGTYPLPEAQLDRFLLEIHIDYPSEQEEREIARKTTSADLGTVPRVLSANDVRALQMLVPRVPVTEPAVALAVALGRATRPDRLNERGESNGSARAPKEVREFVRFGAGPRGSQALVLAAKARAALLGQAAADVDDVRAMITPVLRHRLVLSYRAEAEGVRDVDVLAKVLAACT
jgi:MoxR-like ATPase